MKDYHINIFYIPDLEPCSASDATPEEVLAEVLIAKELWLETAHEEGLTIPEPKYRLAIYQ